MASEWPTATIGDVAKIKHGFAFKSEFFTDEVTPNVLVTPGNFAIGGGFQVGKPKYYAGPLPDDYVLSEGEVVVTMTDLSKASDTLGYAAKVPVTPGVTYWHNQRIGFQPALYSMRSPSTVRWRSRSSRLMGSLVLAPNGWFTVMAYFLSFLE